MQTVSTCCAMFDPCLLPWPLPSRAGGERKGKESSPVLCEAPARTPPLCASCCSCCICVSALLHSNYFSQCWEVQLSTKKNCFSFLLQSLLQFCFHFSWSTLLFSSLMKSCFPHPLNINSFLVLMSQHTPFYMAGRKEKILSLIPDNFQ